LLTLKYLFVKRKVYESLILSILLYGSESWCLTKELFRLLRSFHNRCVHTMCRVNMLDVIQHRIHTEDLLSRLDLNPLDTYVTTRQLRWAGHVTRMGMDRLPRKLLSSWVNNKRPIGAPELTYGRSLFKTLLIRKAGMNWLWTVFSGDIYALMFHSALYFICHALCFS